MGFGESISALMHQNNEWISRGIAVGVVVLLLGECILFGGLKNIGIFFYVA
jgi:hypothetical protein